MTPCGICKKEADANKNNSKWVQCDHCESWFHFTCAGVDDSVKHQNWSCANCDKQRADMHMVHAPVGRVMRSPPQQYISTETLASQAEEASCSIIKDRMQSGASREGQDVDPHTVQAPQMTTETHNNFSVAQQQLMLAMLEEKRIAEEKYIEQKYQLLARMNSAELPLIHEVTRTPGTATNSLSSSQVAARNAIPKDLPIFNGDPEEWPIFSSTFDHSTAVAGFSDTENMLRLQKCLKGKARELVRDKLLIPSMVPEVISTLKMFFGRPEHILDRLVDKARKLQPPKDKLEALIEFALAVRNICATMEACKLDAHLSNPMLAKELIDKLPNQHKLNWAMRIQSTSTPIIKELSDWLYHIAEAASTVVPSPGLKTSTVNAHMEIAPAIVNPRRQEVVYTERSGTAPQSKDPAKQHTAFSCIACESTEHFVAQCDAFQRANVKERWETIKSKRACYRCLKNHRKGCFSKKLCGIDGCTQRHHPLLHNKDTAVSYPANNQAIVGTHQTDNTSDQFFRIVPVHLHAAGKKIQSFAFLDEGSSVTLIDEATFGMLGIKGVPTPLCLQWTGETTREERSSVRASIQISALNSNKQYWLNNVHTVRNIALPKQSINARELGKQYSYLKTLPLHSYHDAVPTILIGLDNWKIAVPRKIREGQQSDPIASKCLLGWSVQGNKYGRSFVTLHHCECGWQELHDVVKESFSLDSVKAHQLQSSDDQRALEILDKACVKVDDRFEVGLLWRNDDIVLPESYSTAVNRINCLKRKITKEPELYDKIDTQIQNLLHKGYARQLTAAEIDAKCERIWYLPIFIALNPNKPGKIRLVWDAAAKSHGASLNDFLLTGPDLLKPLVEVLLSFRVGRFAVCGDIAEMFHRINVRAEDMHAQRFLWYEKDTNQLKAYVMQAMTFGISCAPCIAHYVRNKNAEPYKEQYPRAYEAIKEAHYVDDYIDSTNSEQEAVKIATQVRTIHKAGGFQIRNWVSNSAKVLQQLGDANMASPKFVQFGATEKVLGMYWEPSTDVFKYVLRFARLRRDVITEDSIPTKREALQVLMSIFDPLGLMCCYTVGLKILLQRVWRDKVAWDQELPDSLVEDWLRWKRLLPQVQIVEVPRCYSENMTKATRVELHTFVDASEFAYAAASYLRICYDDSIDCILAAAKSKVAPLKPVSIPRMELQAAVLGVRLANKVRSSRRLKIDSVTYWSDSKTVLQWLKMDPRSFQQFVMHRVGEILESTDVVQWRWVQTKLNVATKVNSSITWENWLKGPDFLRLPDHHWPVFEPGWQNTSTSELRKHLHITRCVPSVNIDVEYFSQWRRLYRAVATFLLYMDRLQAQVRKQAQPQVVTTDLVLKAKNVLYKQAQASAYSKEIESLSAGVPILKRSCLHGLNAYINTDGLLCVHGRLDFINAKDAIILPRGSYITVLLVKHYHERQHHLSHETTINEIKGTYHIPRLRVLYKLVRQNCQMCKIVNTLPEAPQMAMIPAARLASFSKPFTYTGLDYFGPILVNVGRRKEKRWGALFTCLTLRAVHIEIAHSLDTNSCIMCIRNFMARRGTPAEFYSDNGTNFRATEKAVREEIVKLDFNQIVVKYDGIKWRFNPPGAPHMGGAWERLVRSTKAVLKAICPSYSFNDESLRTALMEVEYIINSRPLTFVSLDTADDVALTPNHLLLGASDGYKPVCKNDLDIRQKWNQTQMFADKFWQRWIIEYTPMLTRRVKWFEPCKPIAVGSIVIIVDENLPRNLWLRGRVIGTIMAKDGQVRRATVQTASGVLERPATKIAVLDVGIDFCKQQ